MDIKRAKQEIKDSIEAYLAKDEFGEYLIPAIRQCGQLKPRMLKIQRFWAYILDFFI